MSVAFFSVDRGERINDLLCGWLSGARFLDVLVLQVVSEYVTLSLTPLRVRGLNDMTMSANLFQ